MVVVGLLLQTRYGNTDSGMDGSAFGNRLHLMQVAVRVLLQPTPVSFYGLQQV